jgi:hypothetical protein
VIAPATITSAGEAELFSDGNNDFLDRLKSNYLDTNEQTELAAEPAATADDNRFSEEQMLAQQILPFGSAPVAEPAAAVEPTAEPAATVEGIGSAPVPAAEPAAETAATEEGPVLVQPPHAQQVGQQQQQQQQQGGQQQQQQQQGGQQLKYTPPSHPYIPVLGDVVEYTVSGDIISGSTADVQATQAVPAGRGAGGGAGDGVQEGDLESWATELRAFTTSDDVVQPDDLLLDDDWMQIPPSLLAPSVAPTKCILCSTLLGGMLDHFQAPPGKPLSLLLPDEPASADGLSLPLLIVTAGPTPTDIRFVTAAPTDGPATNAPTAEPTEEGFHYFNNTEDEPCYPTELPTAAPSSDTAAPTIVVDTDAPTMIFKPTTNPTFAPTAVPSIIEEKDWTLGTAAPSNPPTYIPSARPSLVADTNAPTIDPTSAPTQPTNAPTDALTPEDDDDTFIIVTAKPSLRPTSLAPSHRPTKAPTPKPTTPQPTTFPTGAPHRRPTEKPTHQSTKVPTMEPSNTPTREPTKEPTMDPTMEPTVKPTGAPTKEPTKAKKVLLVTARPTSEPVSRAPSRRPTQQPTKAPSRRPTQQPTKSKTVLLVTAQPTTAQPTRTPTSATVVPTPALVIVTARPTPRAIPVTPAPVPVPIVEGEKCSKDDPKLFACSTVNGCTINDECLMSCSYW